MPKKIDIMGLLQAYPEQAREVMRGLRERRKVTVKIGSRTIIAQPYNLAIRELEDHNAQVKPKR